jgi:hypothetical protein
VVLVAAAFAAALALYGGIALAIPAGPLADLTHFKHWARLVTVEGVHSAYSGEYPETYAIYPPVTLLGFRVAGEVYERTRDPAFALEPALASHELSYLIRFQAIVFHLLVGLAVYVVAGRVAPFGPAFAALVAYLFNPGVLFDVAQWGQPDPVFGLFVLIALAAVSWPGQVDTSAEGVSAAPVVWLSMGELALRSGTAGAAIVLAALAKPQAWVFLPLVGLLIWRRGGISGVAVGALAAAAAGALIAAPFVVHGTLRELLGLPRAISNVMPVVSANAHNLWWLGTAGAARWYLDQETLVGPVTYRLVGMSVVAALGCLALLRAARAPSLAATFAAGAYTAFAFFMAMTQIHENHMYVVFPLLAVAAAADRRLWPLYLVLALSWCANMLLHDFDFAEQAVAPLLPWTLAELHQFGALVNTLVLFVWTVIIGLDTVRVWLRPALPAQSVPTPLGHNPAGTRIQGES